MARGLTADQLQHIAALEAACLAADGGRLKLEYPTLRGRSPGIANDFLWWSGEGGELVGFCGIYQYRSDEAEVCGMVHPAFRRRGIFTRLLDAALVELAELAERAQRRVLLIVDRCCEAGGGFAAARGGVLESSEHRMTQVDPPQPQDSTDRVQVRQASGEAGDVAFVRECTAGAFAMPEEAVAGTEWASMAAGTLVIDGDGEPVGVMRVEREPATASAGIYGFGVLPERQRRGYGRAALATVTRALHQEGFSSVHLEVLVDNPAALHLYESCGFAATGIEDYYLLPA